MFRRPGCSSTGSGRRRAGLAQTYSPIAELSGRFGPQIGTRFEQQHRPRPRLCKPSGNTHPAAPAPTTTASNASRPAMEATLLAPTERHIRTGEDFAANPLTVMQDRLLKARPAVVFQWIRSHAFFGQ